MTPRILAVLALLTACSDGSPADGGQDPASLLADPSGDYDGDGLTNGEELEGWTILVNRTGYPDDPPLSVFTIEVAVTSDPTRADTDGDGLDDARERDARTDPYLPDTDGDLLTDAEELDRWGTNPTQADTDGDALPADAEGNPAPLRQLFDGAELKLTPARDAGPGATSPLHADTDGDGWTDHEETISSVRNPAIADTPKLTVNLTEGSLLDLGLDVTYSGAVTETVSHTSSLEVTTSAQTSVFTEASAALSNELSGRYRVGLSYTAGCCLDIASFSVSIEEEYHNRTTFDASVMAGVDQEDSTASTQTHEAFTSRAETTAHTIEGATVQAFVDAANDSSRTYTVENLSVLVMYREGTQLFPLAHLSSPDPLTLFPGEVATHLLAIDDSADPDRVAELMRAPDRLVVTPAGYDIVDITDTPVAFQAEVVRERTARVVVRHPDYVERYDVAVHVPRDADGAPSGLPLRDVFAMLGVVASDDASVNPITGDSEPTITIDGYGVVLHDLDGEDPLSGLDVRGYPRTGGPGPRYFAEQWTALMARPDAALPELTSMLDTVLFAGDVLEIVRATDRDRDGLVDVEEALVGTSDALVDSDALDNGISDGLSDFFEVNEPWTVTVFGSQPYEVYANPTSVDFDGDGLMDDEELAAGTDPLLPDTDSDGWTDASELEAGQSPTTPDDGAEQVEIQCRTGLYEGVWAYEVLVRAPAGAVAAVGMRRNLEEDERSQLDPSPDEIREVFAYPDTLGPPPTAYVVDPLGLEQAVACPLPEPTTTRTCLRCDQTSPPVLSCSVEPTCGTVEVDVSADSADLAYVELRLETDILYRGEEVTYDACNADIGLVSSYPVDLQARGDATLGLVLDTLADGWSSDGVVFDVPIGDLASQDWLTAGGQCTADGYLDLTRLGDRACMDNASLDVDPGVLAPHRFDVALEVDAVDVDGNTVTAVCEFALTDRPALPSCLAILEAGLSTGTGTYRIDPDGPGPDQPTDVWCDMHTDGGGWTLVRNTMSGPTWGPWDDDLKGTADHDWTPWAGTWEKHASWAMPFADIGHAELLFMSGDETRWCALGKTYPHQFRANGQANANILSSGGPYELPAGSLTNVLNFRGAPFPEQPWVGCRGDHTHEDEDLLWYTNVHHMLYGEASSPLYTGVLLAHDGLAVFIR